MINENFSNPLSYKTIKNLMSQFKKSSGFESSDFNKFETPGHYYFKLMFYFNNPSQDENLTSNLLGCDWLTSQFDANNYKFSNSAYNYLMLNDEKERAEKLQKFIYLLSDINSQSPWYFTSITGLDAALERKVFTDKNFSIEEERKAITIKCKPDAYDTRIGTLLDLYRDICYSYINKKEIIPANLRKFDMGIYIFNAFVYNLHGDLPNIIGNPTQSYAQIKAHENNNDKPSTYRTSSKYIELHNCEIDYNSSKSAYSDFSNEDGKSLEYEIIIKFDDAYENRYNEFMMREIGDMVETDLIEVSNSAIFSYPQEDNAKYQSMLSKRTDDKKGYWAEVGEQAAGVLVEQAKGALTSVYLGNLYGLSLSNVKDQVKDIMSGNIFNTVNAVIDYAEHINSLIPEKSIGEKKLWEKPEKISNENKLLTTDDLKYNNLYYKLGEKNNKETTKIDDSVLLMDTSFEDGKMIITRKNINNSNYNFTDANNLAENIYGKKIYDTINDVDNLAESIDNKRLWDKKAIIKKQQETSILNTKRSLFQ